MPPRIQLSNKHKDLNPTPEVGSLSNELKACEAMTTNGTMKQRSEGYKMHREISVHSTKPGALGPSTSKTLKRKKKQEECHC